MKTAFRTLLMLGTLLGLLLLAACSQPHKAQTQLPELSIGVASFSQPTHDLELMAGYIPENQGIIPPDASMRIDTALRTALSETKRSYKYLDPIPLAQEQKGGRSERPGQSTALSHWVSIGQKAGVDLLIVPMVIDWHERQGSGGGVTISAAVTIDMFLVDVRGKGNLLQRSFYSEKQTGLSNNLLELGTFVKRGGKWVTADQLTQEAIQKAIQEFGL